MRNTAMRPMLVLSVYVWLNASPSSVHSQQVNDALLEVSAAVCCPSFPVCFVFLPTPSGQPLEVLIGEKFTGKLRYYRGGVPQADAIDLDVSNFGERGLLGVALHPQFATNQFVYVYYTTSGTGQDEPFPAVVLDNRIERYTWVGGTLVNPELIITFAAESSNHIGGGLFFGPDEMLYGVIGDVGHVGLMQNFTGFNPPDSTSIVYRLRDDGSAPPDNPFFGQGSGLDIVYGYGIRNSFGIDFDPVSGVLWQTENGPSDYDELNRFPPGFNSGWIHLHGPDARDPQGIGNLWMAPGAQYVDPQLSWFSSVAPAGIHFLRSDSLGAHYRNDAFVGMHKNVLGGVIYHFDLTADRSGIVLPDASVSDRVVDSASEAALFEWGTDFNCVVDLDTGPDGALYALSALDNTLYRISRRNTSSVGPSPSVPAGTRLRAWPNPFRLGTRLVVAPDVVANTLRSQLRIYTASGQLLRQLGGESDAFAWDGRDARGTPAPPGVYIVRLETPAAAAEILATAKIVLLPMRR